LDLWYSEIRAIKEAVLLWDMLQKKDREGLAKHIKWYGEVVHYESDDERDFRRVRIDQPRHIPKWPKAFRRGDVVEPGWDYLQHNINEHLEQPPFWTTHQKSVELPRVSPRLLWARGPITLGLFLVPNNLIGALWLQLAFMVVEGRGYRQCAYCAKPF